MPLSTYVLILKYYKINNISILPIILLLSFVVVVIVVAVAIAILSVFNYFMLEIIEIPYF